MLGSVRSFYKEVAVPNGYLKVVTGCMFAQKTLAILAQRSRYEAAGLNFVVTKPTDDRKNILKIEARDGLESDAHEFRDPGQFLRVIRGHSHVIIDEVQFLPPRFMQAIRETIGHGVNILAAGLDNDFRGEPFGIMPLLLAEADEVQKLMAICTVCKGPAMRTQRLVNYGAKHQPDLGPAPYDGPVIDKPEDGYIYQARCREHHELGIGPSRSPD